jgi:prophage regulatory protein
MLDNLLTWNALEPAVPYTRQHVYRLEAKGQFPQRVRVGANRVAWRESEIKAWIEARERGNPVRGILRRYPPKAA